MGADIIAGYIFHNPHVAPLIRISVFSVPFACIHCLVCAYYISKERTVIPAVSQIFEQAVRLVAIYIIVHIAYNKGEEITAAGGRTCLRRNRSRFIMRGPCINRAPQKYPHNQTSRYRSKTDYKDFYSGIFKQTCPARNAES